MLVESITLKCCSEPRWFYKTESTYILIILNGEIANLWYDIYKKYRMYMFGIVIIELETFPHVLMDIEFETRYFWYIGSLCA